MKKCQILGFLIIYVSLSILKISSKSEPWSPEPVRFAMEHTVNIMDYQFTKFKLNDIIFKMVIK